MTAGVAVAMVGETIAAVTAVGATCAVVVFAASDLTTVGAGVAAWVVVATDVVAAGGVEGGTAGDELSAGFVVFVVLASDAAGVVESASPVGVVTVLDPVVTGELDVVDSGVLIVLVPIAVDEPDGVEDPALLTGGGDVEPVTVEVPVVLSCDDWADVPVEVPLEDGVDAAPVAEEPSAPDAVPFTDGPVVEA